MDSASDEPAGVAPGRPLFLIANDLEIDFPALNAIELLAGEDAQLSNSYIQVRACAGPIDVIERNVHESLAFWVADGQ